MTLSEKIAAKKAAVKPTIKESLPVAIDQEAEDAIQRITQPGKHRGLVITPTTAPQRPDVSQPVEVLWEPENRTLGSNAGEGVPMVPANPSAAIETWHHIVNSLASYLCIMSDPQDPEVAWLAIRARGQEQFPILIQRFAYWEHPNTVRPPAHPF
jgi:hypothetical protein